MGIKSAGTNAKVLNERKEPISKKELIIQELLKEEKVKPGQLINYEYFKKIYEPYSTKMSEKDFAEILGITCENYRTIKSQIKRNAKVLKERRHIKEEEKEMIIDELLSQNKIKENQLIDYEFFKEIYKPYKDRVSEIDFAQILGIRYDILIDIKNKREKNKNS